MDRMITNAIVGWLLDIALDSDHIAQLRERTRAYLTSEPDSTWRYTRSLPSRPDPIAVAGFARLCASYAPIVDADALRRARHNQAEAEILAQWCWL